MFLRINVFPQFETRHSKFEIAFLFFFLPSYTLIAQPEPLSLVNPFVGTDAHGHTFPGATVPFGMVQLSPDTRVEGWDACGGYHYSDSTILGFSHTHLSGTGIPDYGDILFLPTIGTPGLRTRQAFSHSTEKASPGYYSVMLDDDNILAELTASARVGVHRYIFPTSAEANILIDLRHGLGPDVVTESWLEFTSDREVTGFRRSTGWAKDQHVYFVAQFSKPFHDFGDVEAQKNKPKRLEGTDVRGFVRFATMAGERLVVKVGISSVDIDGARNNLREVPHWNFEQARQSAEALWQKELRKIKVTGGTEAQQRTFTTALYHTMIAPNLGSDLDGRYRGMDHRIRTADGYDMYTVFSLWDTFRALHPLLTILDPARTRNFVRSMLAKYDEGGVLPVWELASNETWTMIGYHSIPVILDAYVKGIRGFDAEKAFAAMKHSAMLDHFGLKPYREHGLIPGDRDSESVSRTLEYSYDDWCIAEMARLMGRSEDARLFSERAQYYRNMFDPATGFMRPKINGHWADPFDPTSVSVHYTEANAWQYTFFAPHDPAGLIELMGGRDRFEQKLDSLFFGSPEMTGRKQADITGVIGKYAQGNEPSHHFAYLYNYTKSPWKTQKLTRLILDSLYNNKPDGLCGNDDCGQMSAWYVFSAMGIYPVTPGSPGYHITAPIFDRTTVRLENGRSFVIEKKGHGAYVRNLLMDGISLSTPLIQHDDILDGNTIQIQTTELPKSDLKPIAVRNHQSAIRITTAPYFVSTSRSFRDSLRVEIHNTTPGATIFSRLQTNESFREYTSPIVIRNGVKIHAYAEKPGYLRSKAVVAEFVKSSFVGTVRLETRYSHQYTGGGDQALVDRVRGGADFRLGVWQGYEGEDVIAILDLGNVKNIDSVRLGCLQDENSWIFFPGFVEFSFSKDGMSYSRPIIVRNDVPLTATGGLLKEFASKGEPSRFVKVRAKNIGLCPPWHKGAGGKAWVFVDEIVVE
ncbi:MAG: GH92 family glycosyl hydrolase [Bacteroidota bacterium]